VTSSVRTNNCDTVLPLVKILQHRTCTNSLFERESVSVHTTWVPHVETIDTLPRTDTHTRSWRSAPQNCSPHIHTLRRSYDHTTAFFPWIDRSDTCFFYNYVIMSQSYLPYHNMWYDPVERFPLENVFHTVHIPDILRTRQPLSFENGSDSPLTLDRLIPSSNQIVFLKISGFTHSLTSFRNPWAAPVSNNSSDVPTH